MLEPLIRVAQANPVMRPAPINPAWIEAGNPTATSALLAATDDRGAAVMFWHCTAGRFTWRYAEDETVHILEGGVTIKADGLPARFYGPGETIHFSRGAVATWTIDTYIRKIAFCKLAGPRPISLSIRIARALMKRAKAMIPGMNSGAALVAEA